MGIHHIKKNKRNTRNPTFEGSYFMNIYRSERAGQSKNHFSPTRPTMRLPGNVPYVVDNLWEWKRPDNYPNRRHSVYASPCPEIALGLGRKGGEAYRIEVCGAAKIAQLKVSKDSRFHSECEGLKKELLRVLGVSGQGSKWHQSSLNAKSMIGQLWIPGLTKDQVEELFETVSQLKEVKETVSGLVRYWDDVVLLKDNDEIDSVGEIFFETPEGYRLLPI